MQERQLILFALQKHNIFIFQNKSMRLYFIIKLDARDKLSHLSDPAISSKLQFIKIYESHDESLEAGNCQN